MSGGGGKGGKQTTSVTIPAWLEEAAQRNIAKAEDISQAGFTPYIGADFAALSPMQIASMRGTGQAADAFGLGFGDPMAGMPAPQQFAGGVQGYSAYPLYEQALASLQATAPAQYAAMRAPFINPVTGSIPGTPYMTGAQRAALAPAPAAAPFEDESRFVGRGGGDY